jgi:hypothetical protein
MEFSKNFNFIYIANPKTGSRAVRKYLQLWGADCKHNRIPSEHNPDELLTGIPGHTTPRALKKRMGKSYDNYKVVVFIRNPYDKAVSAYFFYKRGRPILIQKDGRNFFQSFTNYLVSNLNYFLTKLLPFSWWSVIKPIKMNKGYLIDDQGKILVNYIGKTETLNQDLPEIGKLLGLNVDDTEPISKVNQSSHSSSIMDYFNADWHKKSFYKKYKEEIDLYTRITEKPIHFDWRNERI